MAGFLDAKERVIDLVLTDAGKSLLLKGELRFSYWIPFDDEINYQPLVTIYDSGSLTPDELASAIAEKTRNLREDPVIVEAMLGYRGMNARQEDMTNVKKPMYTSVPGAGHMSPLPQIIISETGSLEVQIEQTKIVKQLLRKNEAGEVVAKTTYDAGFQRKAGVASYIDVNYGRESFPTGSALEGFLVTVFHDVTGTLQEVIHNRDSSGEVAYRNDLSVTLTG